MSIQRIEMNFESIMRDLEVNKTWYLDRTLNIKVLRNKQNDTMIWMDNIPFLDTMIYWPYPIYLSFWQKVDLYRAAKKIVKEASLIKTPS